MKLKKTFDIKFCIEKPTLDETETKAVGVEFDHPAIGGGNWLHHQLHETARELLQHLNTILGLLPHKHWKAFWTLYINTTDGVWEVVADRTDLNDLLTLAVALCAFEPEGV